MPMTRRGTVPTTPEHVRGGGVPATEQRTGVTGIPDADPAKVAMGGSGTGGGSNTVNPPRGVSRGPISPNSTGNDWGDAHEDSTSDNGGAGAGANTDLFGGGVNCANPSPGGESNVNSAYPASSHLISGTPLPASEATGGSIMKGGRGAGYVK